MKKLFLAIILIVGIFVSNLSQAQDGPKNIVKINFLSPIVSTASLFYERVISESSSVQLGLLYTGAGIGSGDTKTTIRGFAITPEFRYYLSEKGAPQGFFIAPYLRYQNYELTAKDAQTSTDEKATFSGFGGGVLVGGQWIFKQRISLEVFGGPGYTSRNVKYEGTATEEDFTFGGLSGVTFRFGATIGVAF
jgi:hypothetical protein